MNDRTITSGRRQRAASRGLDTSSSVVDDRPGFVVLLFHTPFAKLATADTPLCRSDQVQYHWGFPYYFRRHISGGNVPLDAEAAWAR